MPITSRFVTHNHENDRSRKKYTRVIAKEIERKYIIKKYIVEIISLEREFEKIELFQLRVISTVSFFFFIVKYCFHYSILYLKIGILLVVQIACFSLISSKYYLQCILRIPQDFHTMEFYKTQFDINKRLLDYIFW